MILDSWLDSFQSDDNWEWIYYFPCEQQTTAPHQNQRVYRFSWWLIFFVGASVIPSSLLFCDLVGGCSWPRVRPSWEHLIRLLFSYASMINLCSLVLDRYVAVVKPSNLVTGRRVTQMIFFSWALPFGLIISTVLLSLYLTLEIFITFINVFGMSFEIVSSCMLIFCFTSMVIIVYKHDRSAATLAKQLRFNHRVLTFNTHDKSAVVMMAIVTGLFLVCF